MTGAAGRPPTCGGPPPRKNAAPGYGTTALHDAPPVSVRVLAQRTAVTEAAVRDVQNELRLLDFEGRSLPGRHRHMTPPSAAYLSLRLETSRSARATVRKP
ncbi:hypothetical protein GCM10023347_45160 [Streptomyces chumphonensis]